MEENAIDKYVKIMASGGTAGRRDSNELRVNAKDQLLQSGWSFWMATKYDGRRELRYKAPHGRSYNSLIVACKAYHEITSTNPSSSQIYDNNNNSTSFSSSDEINNNKKSYCSSSDEIIIKKKKKKACSSSDEIYNKKSCSSSDEMNQARVLRPRKDDKVSYVEESDGSSDNDPAYMVDEGCRKKRKRKTVSTKAAHVLMLGKGGGEVRVKRRRSDEVENDSVCTVCADGGDMVLCDQCPASFHHACIGLDATPPGDYWFCPSCRCSVCGTGELDDDDDHTCRFTDKTVIYCDQCERIYHVGCQQKHQKQAVVGQPWVCSDECGEVREHLHSLVGTSRATSVPGVSFTVVRWAPDAKKTKKKLDTAFSVLHECFVTLTEGRTKSDTTKDMLYNRWSEDHLRRLDFTGFYVVGLETAAGGELVTVATLRVYGKEVAELPLVGTRRKQRRRGMCRLLMEEVEALLRRLGVKRLVLPAVEEMLETWTGSFGFKVMTEEEKLDIAQRHTLLCFQGTTMCSKMLLL